MSVLNYRELIQKINYLYKILSTVSVNNVIGIIGYLLIFGEYVKYMKSVEIKGKYYCSAGYAGRHGMLYKDIIVLRNLIAHGDGSIEICYIINNIVDELYRFDGIYDDVVVSLLINNIGVSGLQTLYNYFYDLIA